MTLSRLDVDGFGRLTSTAEVEREEFFTSVDYKQEEVTQGEISRRGEKRLLLCRSMVLSQPAHMWS